VGTVSEVVVLRCRRLWWKELVECVVWIVDNVVEQLIITLLQQLIEELKTLILGFKVVQGHRWWRWWIDCCTCSLMLAQIHRRCIIASCCNKSQTFTFVKQITLMEKSGRLKSRRYYLL